MQRAYWKQRATIRWILQGEANTKYLKVKATINYRRNFIASLQDEAGNMQDDHQAKVAILRRAFKQRLNTSVPTFNLLSLDSLITKMPELIELDKPFTKEEIDAVIKDLPSDKAPGPDG